MTPDAILEAMAQVPIPTPEEPALVSPTKTNLRRVGQFSLTDATHRDRAISNNAKRVLGFSMNYPKLNPSLTDLEEVARLNRSDAADAQDELEEAGIVRYDRPRFDPRRHESNRIVAIRADADPFREENQGRTTSVPPDVMRKLPRGQKHTPILPLATIWLAQQQLRRGGIHGARDVARAIFGLDADAARRLFNTLGSTVLVDEGDGVLSIPGVIKPIDPATGEPREVDKSKTPTLIQVVIGADLSLPVLANEAEENKITVLLDQLPPIIAEWAVVAATLDPRNYAHALEQGVPAGAVIDALSRFNDDPPLAFGTGGMYVELSLDKDYLLAAIRHGRGSWTAVRAEPHEQADSEAAARAGHPNGASRPPERREQATEVLSTSYPVPQVTSFAREVEEEPQDQTSDNGPESRSEELAIEGRSAPLDKLPRSYSSLVLLFGEGLPSNVIGDVARTVEHLAQAQCDTRLTVEQLGAVDTRLRDILTERAEYPNSHADRYALARSAIKRLATDDELHEALKRLRPPSDLGLGDLFDGIGE